MRIQRATIHRSLDLRNRDDRASILVPGVGLLGCDLRGVALTGADLSSVVFLGCRLDGASFAGTTGTRVWVSDCVVTDGPLPIFEGSHIGELIIEGGNVRTAGWSAELTSAMAEALSPDSTIAHSGLGRLAEAGDASVAPGLVPVLSDADDAVRWHALKVLLSLRGEGFPHGDQLLLETIALMLADEESPQIRAAVVNLVKSGTLSRLHVRMVADRVTWPEPADRRIALRAAITLVTSDFALLPLVPLEAMASAIEDSDAEVRRLAIQLFAWVKDNTTESIVLRGLSDVDASVRAAALAAFPFPSDKPPRELVVSLLTDESSTVRMHALGALAACDVLTEDDLAAAASDPSEEVRAIAARLMATLLSQR